MKLPSKELSSELLNIEAVPHTYNNDRNILLYIRNIVDCSEINIYELMHELKLYALDRDYKLLSSPTTTGGMCTSLHKLRKKRKTYTANTEFDAVVEACECIRSNR